jgi:hypothetical protein
MQASIVARELAGRRLDGRDRFRLVWRSSKYRSSPAACGSSGFLASVGFERQDAHRAFAHARGSASADQRRPAYSARQFAVTNETVHNGSLRTSFPIGRVLGNA